MKLPKPGDLLLGKYLLEAALGEGGMGIVFAARHELLGQRVAVKFLRPDAATHGDAVARFVREARAVARIDSDHVARVLDVGMPADGLPYMVLEFLDGIDLATYLSQRGALSVGEAADYMLQAIEGVAHAHAHGIVHRDLKPSNLFLARRQDGATRLKVLDFGISKAASGVLGPDLGLTKSNCFLGTPLYMAPEQLRSARTVDHRCDIWALGVVAFELLTGRPPFDGDNAFALFKTITESEPPSLREHRPDLAGELELEAAIMTCLRRAPEERFASVTELAQALVGFCTVVGLRAFENTRRVLPLGRQFRAPLASSDGPEVDTESEKATEVFDARRIPPRRSAPMGTPGLLATMLAAGSRALGFAPTLQSPLEYGGVSLKPADGDEPVPHRAAYNRSQVDTAEPWSSHDPTRLYRRPGRSRRLVLLVGASVFIASTGGLFVARAVSSTNKSDASAAASAVSSRAPVPAERPSSDYERATLPTGTALSLPSDAGTTDSLNAAPLRMTTANVVFPLAHAPDASPTRPTRETNESPADTHAQPVPGNAARARPACEPPYVVDASGTRRWKMECL